MRVSSVGPFQQTGAGHWCWGEESFVLSMIFQSIEKKNSMKQLTMFELFLLVVHLCSSSFFNKFQG